jgi:hypothetical protein
LGQEALFFPPERKVPPDNDRHTKGIKGGNYKMARTKKIISLMLLLAMLVSMMAVMATSGTAYAALSDYIYADAAGYAYADFPDEYPADLLYQDTAKNTEIKIQALLDETNGGLTKEEKLKMLSADGVMGADTSSQQEERRWGTGIWYGVPRVCIPAIRMFDGPMGVRANTGYQTTRPSNEVSIASAFEQGRRIPEAVSFTARKARHSPATCSSVPRTTLSEL